MFLVLMACKGPVLEPIPEPEQYRCTLGFDDAELSAAIDQARVTAYNEELGAPAAHGVVVGIATPDGELRVEAFGYRDTRDTYEMSPHGVFDVGSIQKNFVWTLLHHYGQEGVIDLDAPAQVSEIDLGGVTPRQLSNHTSGLKHWDDTPALTDEIFDDGWSHEYSYAEMMAFIVDDPWKDSSQEFWYSNYGPLIAGQLITETVGTDHLELREVEMFDRFDMPNSSHQGYDPEPAALVEGWWADDEEHDWVQAPEDAMAMSSAAGGLIFTDACDLLHYGQGVFESEDFLSAETRAAMLDEDDLVSWQGHDGSVIGDHAWGWQRFLVGTPWWGHFGSSQHGHSSAIQHNVDTGVTVVVLSNVAMDSVEGLGLVGDHARTPVAVMLELYDREL